MSRRRLTMVHQKSGGAYLDTGLIAKGSLKVRIRFRLNGESGYIFGGRVSASSDNYSFAAGSKGNWYDGYRRSTMDTGIAFDNAIHELVKDKGATYLDGVQVNAIADSPFTSGRRLLIFACDNNGTVTTPTLMTLLEAQAWDNDVLVRDYRFGLDPNRVACAYDVITQQPSYSQGGPFNYKALRTGVLNHGGDANRVNISPLFWLALAKAGVGV